MSHWGRRFCFGVPLLIGLLSGAHAGYVGGNPLTYTDPEGLATQGEINAAMQTLGGNHPSDFPNMPSTVGTAPMTDGLGRTGWANNILLNSNRFGNASECVKSGDEYQFLQTLAHEMLHVNESLGNRLLSNSIRMGNPLGYFHRKLDDRADAMVTRDLIEKYQKARNADKSCSCR